MKKIFSKKKTSVPGLLVPKVRKHQASMLYTNYETEWRVFAEGSLRNKVFHDDVLNRGDKCLVCGKTLNTANSKKIAHVDKHHHCYMRLCTGNLLPDNSDDIFRKARKADFLRVPDCRQCKLTNPNYYSGCIKKIFPVHRKCHRKIHKVEKALFDRLSKKLKKDFASTQSRLSEIATQSSDWKAQDKR